MGVRISQNTFFRTSFFVHIYRKKSNGRKDGKLYAARQKGLLYFFSGGN